MDTQTTKYDELVLGLKDMINSQRLTGVEIPDDYQWLVETLAGIDAQNKEAQLNGNYASGAQQQKLIVDPRLLDSQEINTVLAGLRILQDMVESDQLNEHRDMPHFIDEDPLSPDGIDTLCEEISLSSVCVGAAWREANQ